MDEGSAAAAKHHLLATPELERYAGLVRRRVTPERFEHILRVVRLAAEIADANGFSAEERAQVVEAALLHDAARDLSSVELMELAPPRLDVERRHPLALHGRAGRALASRWGVTDEVVLDAVEGHVFGVAPEERVGMALYVADVSEEGREVNEDIRELAMTDLLGAYRLAVMSKVEHLERCGKEIHPETMKTYEAMVERP